jgi:hypothetical protein
MQSRTRTSLLPLQQDLEEALLRLSLGVFSCSSLYHQQVASWDFFFANPRNTKVCPSYYMKTLHSI